MNQPPAIPILRPGPFQRYASVPNDAQAAALSALTWPACFAFTRQQIQQNFVLPLCNAPILPKQFTYSVRERASLLSHMLTLNIDRPDSVAVHKSVEQIFPNIKVHLLDTIDPKIQNPNRLGYITWSPTHPGREKLQCYTVFDVLAASMCDAITDHGSVQPPGFFEQLLSLFAHWCHMIRQNGNRTAGYRPEMLAIINVKDTIVLGASIPRIPGMPHTKESIQQARQVVLGTQQLRKDKGSHKRLICEEAKSMEGGQSYGHCAETMFFSLLCMMNKEDRVQAKGLAMKRPDEGFLHMHSERLRFKRPCDNCHCMFKRCIEDDAGRNGGSIRNMAHDFRWWSSP